MPSTDARPRWPRTLYGRLVLVLVAGMLAAQLLTGTVWFDIRYERVQEIPARLVGARVAQALRILESHTGPGDDLADLLTPDFNIGPIGDPPPPGVPANDERRVEHMIEDAMFQQSGIRRELRLRSVTLFDDQGRRGKRRAMDTAERPHSEFVLDARAVDGRWFHITAVEGQAGLHQRPFHAFGEYALRVYGLRTVLILLLALLLVRWITRPLTDLAFAARALGRNLGAPPLPVSGPVEVRDAAVAFNQMQERLTRAVAYRDELLAAVSHDLRTPITRMRLRTEMITDAPARERLRDELAQMQRLVDSILDYLAAGAAPQHMHPLNLNALVHAVAEDARDMGHDVTEDTRPGGGVVVDGDSYALRRALTNLVDNAVRYGQRARLHVSGPRIVLDDDGPGISDDAMSRVMEPYFRLDRPRGAGSDGTGLGLSIASRLLEAQGGTLHLENRREGGGVVGLRVTVTLNAPTGPVA